MSSSSSSSSSHDKEEAEKEAKRLAEQAQLDDEMLKRRERVRQWQEEKALKMKVMVRYNKASTTTEEDSTKATSGDGDTNEESGMVVDGDGDAEETVRAPGWSLEDEEEEVVDDSAMSSIPPDNDDDDPIGPPPLPRKPDRYADDESVASLTPSRATLRSLGAIDDGDETSDYMSLDIDMPSYDHSGTTANQLSSGQSSAGKVNPYGSNFITLDQIMGMLGSGGNGNGRNSNSGWESDASSHGGADSTVSLTRKKQKGKRGGVVVVGEGEGLTVETDEEREAREERERIEFIEAIRAARVAEETVYGGKRVGGGTAKTETTGLGPGPGLEEKEEEVDAFGRVFADEGDVVEEAMHEEKKKRTALELLEDSKKGKELKPVDHSKIDYLSFRKNLYIVPRALARLTEAEINERREDLSIKVRGKGCPAPVESWEQCGLSERVLQCLERLSLTSPFAIQQQAIPAIMCGRDLIAVAKTGSGKTLAFLLPMFRHILVQPPLQEGEGPICLIMAPARELAFQIFNEAKKFSKSLGLRVACVYGGAGVAEQIADLKRGAEIVVCTPGRMIDILCMQAGKMTTLRRVTMVVIDEADRCFDMGFAPQIDMILSNVRPDRQTVLFSATFPKQIEKLAKSVLRLPLEVVVGERSTVNKDITQIVEVHEDTDKFMRLLQLLGVWYERGSVLIFVETQEKCDQLFADLLKAGYPCLSLHGGKDQLDRDHTLHEFKKGIKTVMVATSVAGRGLDVPEIVVVVNYHCPNHLEDYVHRVGRTGRAGRKGTAYTFISSSEEQYAPLMAKALEKAGTTLPAELVQMVTEFKEKVSRGDAKYRSTGQGFEGKGFTFDASEMTEQQKNASLQKRAYEVEQGLVDDGAEATGMEQDEEGGDATGPGLAGTVTGNIVMVKSVGSSSSGGGTSGGTPSSGSEGLTGHITRVLASLTTHATALDKARAVANCICADKQLPVAVVVPGPPAAGTTGPTITLPGSVANNSSASVFVLTSMSVHLTSTGHLAGSEVTVNAEGKLDIRAALTKAKQVALDIVRQGRGTDHATTTGLEVGVPGQASYEFDINDYPPMARRRVTNKQTMDDVCEQTGVAIIARGSYQPPNKKLEEGERRLYLLIEGPSEMQVRQAVLELTRQLDEETLRVSGLSGQSGSSQSGATGGGRYSVL